MRTLSAPLLESTRVRLLVGAFLLGVWGCAKRASEAPEAASPVLYFDSPSYDAGIVRMRQGAAQVIQHSFRFHVSRRSSAKIVRVMTSCGCMTASEDVVGQELAPGSNGFLPIRLEASGRVGPIHGRAAVLTDPPTRTPLLLTVDAIVVAEPSVAPNPATIHTIQDSDIPITLRVTYLHEPAQGPIRLRQEASAFGLCELVDEQHTSEQRVDPNDLAHSLSIDRFVIRLAARGPLEVGEHEFTIRLEWDNPRTRSEVPVSIYVEPPVSLSVSSVFLGLLQPNEETEVTIPLRKRGAYLNTPLTAQCDLDFVRIDLGRSSRELRIGLRAPAKEGRFKGMIKIRLAGGSPPQREKPLIELPVSGIVRASGQ